MLQVLGRYREVSTRNTGRRSNPIEELRQQIYTFYNSENEETGSSDDSSENYEEEIEDIGEQGDADSAELVPEDVEGATKAENRKERRHAKKAREREGDRRRREGKPRNYLLVDQYTGKPYGAGVSDWCKEVILLSKKLDPAIGQINKQPQDAVKEITEWIEQTWEYSTPIRFEVVKDVVARGVSLRRAELWKKIRNKEPKPEDVTDRAWRSLKKELQNPATIQKSMMCSKANASRVNFGRTGPSGEVGVRERLRRQLRRSPDPEEIQQEMARDKGYGGRSKRKHIEASIMHNTVRSSLVSPFNGKDNEHVNDTVDADTPPMKSTSSLEPPTELGCEKADDEAHATSSGAQFIMDPHIRTNPFVLNLMDRLAALENSLRSKSAEVTALTANQSGRDTEPEADVTALEVRFTFYCFFQSDR
jgi:hypothetical protein